MKKNNAAHKIAARVINSEVMDKQIDMDIWHRRLGHAPDRVLKKYQQ